MSYENTHQKRPGRPRGAGLKPYKLALTLLYGQHKWIERSETQIRIPVSRAASHFKLRAARLQEYLYLLEDWGILTSVKWNQYWATIEVQVPQGMSFIVGQAAIDV